MLETSKISTNVDPAILIKLERLGEVVQIEPNATIFDCGDAPDYLYVNLEGNIYLPVGDKQIWVGPGDILGEIGYILNTPRTIKAMAGETGCTLWRTHRRLLTDHSLTEYAILITHLLLALAPSVNLRFLTISMQTEPNLDLGDEHCDHTHPAIVAMAEFLRGKDEWDSAIQVWDFVRIFPYRFGFWNVRASQTLEFGFGMCTTKANLQVALLRALGIEAHFAECEVAFKYLIPFLPAAYRSMITKNIKHYYGIVTIDGTSYRADASFSREALQIFAEAHPEYRFVVFGRLEREREFILEKPGEMNPYTTHEDLSHVMGKRPFFDAGNAEAMNILLDRYQGPVVPMPHWVASTKNLLAHNPTGARKKALAGIISDLTRLHQAAEDRRIQTTRVDAGLSP